MTSQPHRPADVPARATRTRKFFVVFTFSVYVLFGALAAIGAVGGVVALFFTPGVGAVMLVAAVVLGVMSWQVKRTFDSLVAA